MLDSSYIISFRKLQRKGISGSTRVSDYLQSTSYMLDILIANLLWPRTTFSKVPVVPDPEKLFIFLFAVFTFVPRY